MAKSLTTVVVALVLAVVAFAATGAGDVEGKEARRLVAAGARLVDVRTPAEFAAGHIEGAENVPVQDLKARLEELEPKDRDIVVYCQSGRRSGLAVRTLRDAGYTKVHDLGPMSRW